MFKGSQRVSWPDVICSPDQWPHLTYLDLRSAHPDWGFALLPPRLETLCLTQLHPPTLRSFHDGTFQVPEHVRRILAPRDIEQGALRRCREKLPHTCALLAARGEVTDSWY